MFNIFSQFLSNSSSKQHALFEETYTLLYFDFYKCVLHIVYDTKRQQINDAINIPYFEFVSCKLEIKLCEGKQLPCIVVL